MARIVNTPLPPVPGGGGGGGGDGGTGSGGGGHKLERKDSGLSVNSNSLYGKFVPDYGEDAIYCRPTEFGNMPNSYHDLRTDSYHDIDYRDSAIVLADGSKDSGLLSGSALSHDYVWPSAHLGRLSPGRGEGREGPPLPPRVSSCDVP